MPGRNSEGKQDEATEINDRSSAPGVRCRNDVVDAGSVRSCGDGGERWTYSRATPLLSPQGEIVEWFGAASDVTARKQAEEMRDRFFMVSQDLLATANFETGNWSRVNPAFTALLGWTEQEILAMPFLDLVHPDDLARSQQAIAGLMEGEVLRDFEHRVLCKDGTYRWIAWQTVADVGERLLYCSGRDLEDRKRAEAARRQVEENLRLFAENVHEYAFVQTDPEGVINAWNPGAERLFGYRPDQVLNRNFSSLLTPEDAHARVFQKELALVAGGKRSEDARWFVREDGSRFWARWISEPVFDETGKFRGVAKIMRDETEREKADASVRHSLVEKEELLKAILFT